MDIDSWFFYIIDGLVSGKVATGEYYHVLQHLYNRSIWGSTAP